MYVLLFDKSVWGVLYCLVKAAHPGHTKTQTCKYGHHGSNTRHSLLSHCVFPHGSAFKCPRTLGCSRYTAASNFSWILLFFLFFFFFLEFNSPWFIHINKEALRGLFIFTINVWPRESFRNTFVARKVKPKTWVVPFMQIILNGKSFHIQIIAQAYSEHAYVVI